MHLGPFAQEFKPDKNKKRRKKRKKRKKERRVYRNPLNSMLTSHSTYLGKKLYYITLNVAFRFLLSPVNITRVYILYKS